MPSFNRSTTGKEVVAAFPSSVAGKTSISLAHGSPSQLILLGRSEARIAPVIEAIKGINASITTKLVLVDLADQASIRAAAAKINDDAGIERIDAVVNCAGIMARPTFEVTRDGIEAQFGVLEAGERGGARVVNVSSTGFELGPVRFEDWNFKEGKEYNEWLAYAQSKTGNVLFTAALAEKLKGKGVQSFALQPGQSNLSKHVKPESWTSALTIANETSGGKEVKMEQPKTLQEGAATPLVARIY
ncbi:Retinol dehydrogenase 13 [Lachnellula arida]|uniref:Retinol dehydrogenase 13 n=1 Tax=Lachnellula arida TaxID=1316785 RepID=A0A8T9B6Y4_9HELO|nr:Retinol dehydrogenase 13 [Lachnellula arida]